MARKTTLQEWSGRGWHVTAWIGGAIAPWSELVKFRIRIANDVYPEWAGPFQRLRARQSYCTPCSEPSSLFDVSSNLKPLERTNASLLVLACCPPGKHVHTPDAVFLGRKLRFVHDSGLVLHFDPEDAVRGCMFDATNADLAPLDKMPTQVKVQHAEQWRKLWNNPKFKSLRNFKRSYDWTFSTRYWGCPVLQGVPLKSVEDPSGKMPIDLLTAKDEILFYQEIEQYADDLGDEGNVVYTVRVRIMPNFFYVLSRVELHVVNVVVRQIDTRWLHVFGSLELLREWSWREVPSNNLRLAQQGWKGRATLRRPIGTQKRIFHRFALPGTS